MLVDELHVAACKMTTRQRMIFAGLLGGQDIFAGSLSSAEIVSLYVIAL